MADTIDAEIARLRQEVDATTDAELAALLGIQRSAISQWRKRGRVPEKAKANAKKLAWIRAQAVSAEARVNAMPQTAREVSRALAAVFIVSYSSGDARLLLRWSADFDVVSLAAFRLIRLRQMTTGLALAECYEALITDGRFFHQDLLEQIAKGVSELPQ